VESRARAAAAAAAAAAAMQRCSCCPANDPLTVELPIAPSASCVPVWRYRGGIAAVMPQVSGCVAAVYKSGHLSQRHPPCLVPSSIVVIRTVLALAGRHRLYHPTPPLPVVHPRRPQDAPDHVRLLPPLRSHGNSLQGKIPTRDPEKCSGSRLGLDPESGSSRARGRGGGGGGDAADATARPRRPAAANS
jgi:hypothetical protein